MCAPFAAASGTARPLAMIAGETPSAPVEDRVGAAGSVEPHGDMSYGGVRVT